MSAHGCRFQKQVLRKYTSTKKDAGDYPGDIVWGYVGTATPRAADHSSLLPNLDFLAIIA